MYKAYPVGLNKIKERSNTGELNRQWQRNFCTCILELHVGGTLVIGAHASPKRSNTKNNIADRRSSLPPIGAVEQTAAENESFVGI